MIRCPSPARSWTWAGWIKTAARVGLALALIGSTPSFAASADKKSVTLKWGGLEAAEKYEIEIKRKGVVLLTKRVTTPDFTGDLPHGLALWRTRAIDALGRPGEWSEARPVVVMPTDLQFQDIKDGGTIGAYGPEAPLRFTWKEPGGVAEYRIEATRDGKRFFQTKVTGPAGAIKGVRPGPLQITITPVIRASADDQLPKNITTQEWIAPNPETLKLRAELRQFGAVKVISPKGLVLPPDQGKLSFRWLPADGAKTYEIKVWPDTGPQSKAGPANKADVITVYSSEPQTLVTIPRLGPHFWKIRALATDRPDPKAKDSVPPGPETLTAFAIDANAVNIEGSGYLALSTMIAPYTYDLNSTAYNTAGSTTSAATTVRLSGEYFASVDWGLGVGLEATVFRLQPQSSASSSAGAKTFSRFSGEFLAKYRIPLSNHRFGWFVAPKFGVEVRDYPHITLSPVTGDFSQTKYTPLGGVVGLDVRKQFTDALSIGARVSYFLPVFLLSAPTGTQFTSGKNTGNLSVGLQGLYWLKSKWGIGAGALMDFRSLGVKGGSLPNQDTTPEETITLNATYLYLSLIYRFGQ